MLLKNLTSEQMREYSDMLSHRRETPEQYGFVFAYILERVDFFLSGTDSGYDYSISIEITEKIIREIRAKGFFPTISRMSFWYYGSLKHSKDLFARCHYLREGLFYEMPGGEVVTSYEVEQKVRKMYPAMTEYQRQRMQEVNDLIRARGMNRAEYDAVKDSVENTGERNGLSHQALHAAFHLGKKLDNYKAGKRTRKSKGVEYTHEPLFEL